MPTTPPPPSAPQPGTNIQVSKNGKLNLPYNQKYAESYLNAQNEFNNDMIQMDSEANQQALEHSQALRNQQQQFQGQQLQNRNVNAAQGTVFSSKYGTAVSNTARTHANTIADLEMKNTSFRQNLTARQNQARAFLNNQLALLSQQYANELGGQAGKLGYGQAKPPVAKAPKPKPKKRVTGNKGANIRLRKELQRKRRKGR